MVWFVGRDFGLPSPAVKRKRAPPAVWPAVRRVSCSSAFTAVLASPSRVHAQQPHRPSTELLNDTRDALEHHWSRSLAPSWPDVQLVIEADTTYRYPECGGAHEVSRCDRSGYERLVC